MEALASGPLSMLVSATEGRGAGGEARGYRDGEDAEGKAGAREHLTGPLCRCLWGGRKGQIGHQPRPGCLGRVGTEARRHFTRAGSVPKRVAATHSQGETEGSELYREMGLLHFNRLET